MTDINQEIEKEVSRGEVGAYSFVADQLKNLKETYGSEVPDASTKEGYNRSKQISGEMTKLRTSLEAKRKEIKAPAIAFGKLIDSQAKELTEQIKAIEEPHKLAYREVDAKKKRLKEEAEQRLLDIKNMPDTCFDKTPSEIESMIDELACVSIDFDTFRHKLEEAENWIPSILQQLSGEHAKAVEREVEQQRIESERIELEKLRREAAEREERERLEREEQERIKREKEIAEQARIEAEQKAEREKQLAAERAERLEREKQEAIERAEIEAKQAAERAEQEKLQAIEQEKERQRQEQVKLEQEAKAREENKKHRAKINNAALKCFVNGGLTEEQAKLAVTLIASKQIDNVSIYY